VQQHANCHPQSWWGPLGSPSDEIQIQVKFQIPGRPRQHFCPHCCLGTLDMMPTTAPMTGCVRTDQRAHVAVAASISLEAASGQGSASSTLTSFVNLTLRVLLCREVLCVSVPGLTYRRTPPHAMPTRDDSNQR
jgi:hypothetical protein